MICIYKITNPIGQVYIGKTKCLRTRLMAHKNSDISKINYSFRTYGFENHLFEIITYCSEELLSKYEAYFYKKYNPQLNGTSLYNTDSNLDVKPKEKNILVYVRPIGNYTYKFFYIKKGKEIEIFKRYKNLGYETIKIECAKLISKLQSDSLTKCADEVLKSKLIIKK